jgi:multicomponent Na+:H+ antiporter subunit G
MSNPIALLLLLVGLAFNLLGCVGLIRLPDVYNRLQAATKCVTLGTCLVLAAVLVQACGSHGAMAAKAALCIVFIVVTAPTAAHALARGAHASRVKLWEKSVVDRYAEDHEPGVESEETP